LEKKLFAKVSVTEGQKQCCGAENISFGSNSTEPQIRIPALAPSPPAPDGSIRYLEINDLFDLSNRIKIVTIKKNFFSKFNHDFFLLSFFKSLVNDKESELQFVVSASAPQHWYWYWYWYRTVLKTIKEKEANVCSRRTMN
jgi:hypothetical protein